jgi:hypothetical protein
LRIDAVADWLVSQLGAEHFKAISPLLATAAQVTAYEKLMQRAGVSSSFSGQRPASERRETVDEATWNSWSYSQKKSYSEKMSGGGGR